MALCDLCGGEDAALIVSDTSDGSTIYVGPGCEPGWHIGRALEVTGMGPVDLAAALAAAGDATDPAANDDPEPAPAGTDTTGADPSPNRGGRVPTPKSQREKPHE